MWGHVFYIKDLGSFFKSCLGVSMHEPEGRDEWCQGQEWGGALCSLLGLFTPQLKPILADIEYLQDQHLLLTVKSMDGYESYGEG